MTSKYKSLREIPVRSVVGGADPTVNSKTIAEYLIEDGFSPGGGGASSFTDLTDFGPDTIDAVLDKNKILAVDNLTGEIQLKGQVNAMLEGSTFDLSAYAITYNNVVHNGSQWANLQEGQHHIRDLATDASPTILEGTIEHISFNLTAPLTYDFGTIFGSVEEIPEGGHKFVTNESTSTADLTCNGYTVAPSSTILLVRGSDDVIYSIGGAGAVASNEFLDSLFKIVDDSDPTREVKFQLDQITAGNTRVLTVPDKDGTIATLSDVAGAEPAGIPAEFQPNNTDSETGYHLIEYYTDPVTGDDATGEVFSQVNKFQTIQGCLDDIVAKGVKADNSVIAIYGVSGNYAGNIDTNLVCREIIFKGDLSDNELLTQSTIAAKVKPAVGSLAATIAAAQVTWTPTTTYTKTTANSYEKLIIPNISQDQIPLLRPQVRAPTDLSSGTSIDAASLARSIPSWTTAYIVDYQTTLGSSGATFFVNAPNVGTFRFVGCKIDALAYDVVNVTWHGCRDATANNSSTNFLRTYGVGFGGWEGTSVGGEGSGANYKYVSVENDGRQVNISNSYMKRQRTSCHGGKVFVENNVFADSTGLCGLSLGGGDFANIYVENNDWYRTGTHSLYITRKSRAQILGLQAVWDGNIFMRLMGGEIECGSNTIYGNVGASSGSMMLDCYVNDATFGGQGRGMKAAFFDAEQTNKGNQDFLKISNAHDSTGFAPADLPQADTNIANSTGTTLR